VERLKSLDWLYNHLIHLIVLCEIVRLKGIKLMPTISMFFGIIITMYYFDDEQHSTPHIHVKYQGENAVFSIPHGELIVGKIKSSKTKLIQAWIEIHQEDLMANWELAINGNEVFKIDPLR
jgi:hypothetical protein